MDETVTPAVVRYNEPSNRAAADSYTTEQLRPPPGQPSDYYHDTAINRIKDKGERQRRLNQRRQALKRFKEIRNAEHAEE